MSVALMLYQSGPGVPASRSQAPGLTGIDIVLDILYKNDMMAAADRYREALDAALREYETLGRQRAEMDERLARLAQTIGSLTRLCHLTPTVPFGLTDACRMVLKAAGHPLTALEVRAQLDAMGFDLARYSNDLASIHTVLKRLNHAGEAEFVPRAWEKPAYGWKRPVRVFAVSSREEGEAIVTGASRRARGHQRGRKR